MAGYTRNDTGNNIADGNLINAADLDGEFDSLQAAFHASTGHTHDGTAANGAPITKLGPTQDVTISGSAIIPKTNNVVDFGSTSFRFKDGYFSGTVTVNGVTASTATLTSVTVAGGTINNTSVGATTPSTGAFTTLTSNSTTTLNGTSIPSSKTLVDTDSAQTLTNKTLTAPTLNSPVLVTPNLGTPSAATLTNATGLPIIAGTTGTLSIARGGTGSTSTAYCNLTSNVTGTLPSVNGGTGQTSYTDGQLLIGNTAGTLSKSTLTAGTGVAITNGNGTITISASGTGGTVTSVAGTGTVNGITLTGTVTSSGSLTLGGVLTGVDLAAQITGTLPIANGGTGSTSTTYCNLASNVTGTLPIANGGTGNTNGTVAKLLTSGFSVEEVSNELVIKFGATTIGKIDSSGNFTVIGNVISNGTL
jgi:hypothetical protein